MRLLVLGGTRFVGRAVVREAMTRGWQVTVLHRGVTGPAPDGVRSLLADRRSGAALGAALGRDRWDLVVDTWAGAPVVAGEAARQLRGRVGRYAYVSSRSVYVWGSHRDERSPVVQADPGSVGTDYPADKRGAEIAVLDSFPDALLCRAGLILGPYEDTGRLPWWLGRIARGGRVLAPGRPGRPLQYVDARDLAQWLLSGLAGPLTGAVDVAGPSGHASMADLLAACVRATGSAAELVWVQEGELAAAGVEPWTQLPCWVPETGDSAGFLESDTGLAAATGLRCRRVEETVVDTWRWLQERGQPAPRPDRPAPGLPAELEAQILGAPGHSLPS